MTQERFKLFTDGSCLRNPGPGGWAALIIGLDGKKEASGGEAETTNNRMEMMAVIKGLESLPGGSAIDLYTDSMYVKNGITLWVKNWKANGWKTAAKKPVLNKDLWIAISEEVAKHRVTWHWVKGHSGHPENTYVDKLARRQAQKHAQSA